MIQKKVSQSDESSFPLMLSYTEAICVIAFKKTYSASNTIEPQLI